MTATPTTGNEPARQRNWAGYLRFVFWVAYLYVPWHYGVFFGQRVKCIYLPRDWILYAFALFGYITLAAIIIIYRTQPEPGRSSLMVITTGISAVMILGLMIVQFWQLCL